MSDTARVYIPPQSVVPDPPKPKKSRRRRKLYTKVARRGRRSREKGAEGEREIASMAREEGFAFAKRTAPMQAAHADEFEDVAEVGRLAIESKRYRRTPVNAFAREVLAKERPGFIPVLAYRDDHQPETFAVVKLRDLLRLERQALRAGPSLGTVLRAEHEAGGGAWQAIEDSIDRRKA
jgi:Holliday junction resolvase